MHSATLIANKFLELASANKDTLTPMQLIKLVYLAHGWMLGLYGRPLITDSVEAWAYGPVIPDLYHVIKHYKDQPVSQLIKHKGRTTLDEIETNLIEQVYGKYGKKSGIHLSRLTHLPDSPWSRIWTEGSSHARIPNDLIEDYFAEQAAAAA